MLIVFVIERELPIVDVLQEEDTLAYFNLSEVSGVQELPKEKEANSERIYIQAGIPVEDRISHEAYVRMHYVS